MNDSKKRVLIGGLIVASIGVWIPQVTARFRSAAPPPSEAVDPAAVLPAGVADAANADASAAATSIERSGSAGESEAAAQPDAQRVGQPGAQRVGTDFAALFAQLARADEGPATTAGQAGPAPALGEFPTPRLASGLGLGPEFGDGRAADVLDALLELELHSVVQVGERCSALLGDRLVRPGDVLAGGVRVRAIADGAIELEWQGRCARIELAPVRVQASRAAGAEIGGASPGGTAAGSAGDASVLDAQLALGALDGLAEPRPGSAADSTPSVAATQSE